MENKKSRNFWDDYRFEFILYINNGKRKDEGDNIVCQRRFDVRGYNKQVLKSEELKELIDNIVGMNTIYGTPGIIPNYFKKLAVDNCWKYYRPYRLDDNQENKFNLFDDEDAFTFEIKVDNNTVIKRQFSGNWFDTNVRYTVNITKIIPEIVQEIQEYFSKKAYTTTYAGVDLNFQFAPYNFEVK